MTQNADQQSSLSARLGTVEAELTALRRLVHALLEAAAWAAVALPCGVLLLVVRRPGGFIWPQLFNIAHALLSAVAALVALRLSRRLFCRVFASPLAHHLVALAFAGALGAGLEVAQLMGPGEGSLKDLARDSLGALAAVAFTVSLDPQVTLLRTAASRWWLRLAGLAFAAASLLSPARGLWPVYQRYSSFPRLAGFESKAEQGFVLADSGATLTLVRPPPGFTRATGQHVGQVIFATGQYPKLEISGLFRHWSSARTLAFEVYSEAPSPVELQLRIHEKRHRSRYSDRFNTTLRIPPGESTQRIAVRAIRQGPSGREMDLSKLEAIIVFVNGPKKAVRLWFDEFRVE